MEKVKIVSEENNTYRICFLDIPSSRKMMKISIFLNGFSDISTDRLENEFVVKFNEIDEYAEGKILLEVVGFLTKNDFDVECDDSTDACLNLWKNYKNESDGIAQRLSEIKSNDISTDSDFKTFCDFCDSHLCITLRDYQYKSAYLLSTGKGGFDFSVPGAGKTIITYATYEYLRSKGLFDKVFVIGPGNAVNAWSEEYETCFGKIPDITNLSFEQIKGCKLYLNASSKNHTEITFINFEKARICREAIINFLMQDNALLIIDEAHKVKNPGASVTESVCEISKYAKARIILTGTPMPNGYEDLYSLLLIFSPFKEILPYRFSQLKGMTKKGATREENDKIRESIRPYYSRISKRYLIDAGELTEPQMYVINCHMDSGQELLYEKINSFCGRLSDEIDEALIEHLKKAALIRKMQISANPALLKKSLVSSMDELKEEYAAFSDNVSSEINELTKADRYMTESIGFSELMRTINGYESGHIKTAKNLMAVKKAKELIEAGENVLIWDIFVSNMVVLKGMLIEALGNTVEMINGSVSAEERQEAIMRFRKRESKVLLANPATLAESISLHKVCQNAIYVNRNFNAAQFIQSKDRIHRINMPQGTTATYYFIENEDSVDVAVRERLDMKEQRMLAILDADDIEVGGAELNDVSIMSSADIEASFMR